MKELTTYFKHYMKINEVINYLTNEELILLADIIEK